MKFVIAFIMVLAGIAWGQENADSNLELGLNPSNVTEGTVPSDLNRTTLNAVGAKLVPFCEHCQKEIAIFEQPDDGDPIASTSGKTQIPDSDSTANDR